MSTKPHENIRIMVIQLLRNILKEILEEKLRLTKNPKDSLLLKLIESPDVVILIPQEVYVSPTEKRSVDMAFSNRIIFEIKSDVSEFDQAVKDAEEKYLGKELTRQAKFFIVTNYHMWRIYEIIEGRSLKLMFDGDIDKAKGVLKQIILQIGMLKVYPLPENIVRLFSIDIDKILDKLGTVFNNVKEDARVRPLYEAYRNIMQMLYGKIGEGKKVGEEFFEELFVRHTYMHMIVISSLTFALGKIGNPEDVVSGVLLDVDVALPYLNWWKIAIEDQRIKEVLNEVSTRADLVDWEVGLTEDVFRVLYEELIDPETRRRIGEYYTPLWLADFMLHHFDLKGKTILDPFCGSGTFLVRAFHKKVELGEEPDKAFESLVGYDINPLAVTVARAELIIAYIRRVRHGSAPKKSPHIYHVDTFALWFGEEQFLPEDIRPFVSAAKSYLQTLINFNLIKIENVLEELSGFENLITKSIRYAYADCSINKSCLEKKIEEYIEELGKEKQSSFIKAFLNHSKKASIPSKLAELIVKYGGNDVWGLIMVSVYAPILLTRFKPSIIVTNPPWVPVTEYKAPYIDKVKEYIKEKVLSTKAAAEDRASNVVTGSDIAIAALGKSLEIAKEGVAFIMNREQLFYHKFPTAGVVATYAVLSSTVRGEEGIHISRNYQVKIYDIDFDVFQHGVYPAVIVVKKVAE